MQNIWQAVGPTSATLQQEVAQPYAWGFTQHAAAMMQQAVHAEQGEESFYQVHAALMRALENRQAQSQAAQAQRAATVWPLQAEANVDAWQAATGIVWPLPAEANVNSLQADVKREFRKPRWWEI